ncbi:hypothetical protein ACEZ3G_14180 [Maribacter algicola]|uniref:Uncharacterized protein n=1 Tax=Meishania litoralis TaxID=3434685 RepID=A0ACC7LLF6_9FLAO
METNKFEEHIAKKMNEREIQPSPAAWEKISGQLETSRTPKRKSYLWYSVAAGFIGLLIISALFYNENDALGTPETVNGTKAKEKNNIEKVTPIIIDTNKTEIVLEDGTDDISDDEYVESHKMVDFGLTENENASITSARKEILSNKNIEETMIPDTVVEAKITELLAQVEAIEETGPLLTDTEVDSLLRKAQQEIMLEKLMGNGASVDAMALLNEVEEELDQSFRDQILEKLKSGFLKVRTAVADRNN